MKKLLLLAICSILLFSVNAQERRQFRVGANLGVAVPQSGSGVAFDIEGKYNTSDRMNIGFRWATAIISKDVAGMSTSHYANFSYLGTADYYLNWRRTSITPFVGWGAGYYQLAKANVGGYTTGTTGKLGAMARTGLEIGRIRATVEYNLVPRTRYSSSIGLPDATSNNSYWVFSVGFYIGGGDWRW